MRDPAMPSYGTISPIADEQRHLAVLQSGSSAPTFSRPRLASGIAGIAGRLAFGLQGDVMGGLPGDLGIARRLLGFHGGIAGGLLGGLTGNAGQPGTVTLGSARRASDADGVTGGLSFGECRVVLSRISCETSPVPSSSRSRLRSVGRQNSSP